MQEFDNLLHVADLVWEELDDCLESSDFAKLAQDEEESLDLRWYFVRLGYHSLTDV